MHPDTFQNTKIRHFILSYGHHAVQVYGQWKNKLKVGAPCCFVLHGNAVTSYNMPSALRALIWASESSSSTFFLEALAGELLTLARAPATLSGRATLLGGGSSWAGVIVNDADPEAAGRLLGDPLDPVWEREMPGGSLAWTLLGT